MHSFTFTAVAALAASSALTAPVQPTSRNVFANAKRAEFYGVASRDIVNAVYGRGTYDRLQARDHPQLHVRMLSHLSRETLFTEVLIVGSSKDGVHWCNARLPPP